MSRVLFIPPAGRNRDGSANDMTGSVGAIVADILIVPLNPPTLFRVRVEEADDPALIVKVDGSAEKSKSWTLI